MRIAGILVWCVFAIAQGQTLSVSGQPNAGEAPRRKIGLALAGGGAKGLAHIGVLQWMEENRIPVDAVAGTSMGGLVGGIFAAGLSSAELKQFVHGIDWNILLANATGYDDLTFRRKEDVQSFPASLELGLKDGRPQLPAGLNAGHQIQLLFEQIGLPYSELRSFDDLPTPFRCVAADLLTGNKVVFQKSSLSQALRATMSIPAVFSPVHYDGMLLVDGGLVDNIPADVVREMNVDVVIAVDLGMETIDPERVDSVFGVISRSLDVMIRRNAIESLRTANIVVTPAVLDFTTMGFRDSEQIIERGYVAAQAMAGELKQYAVSATEWNAYIAARKQKTREFAFSPAFVEVSGGTPQDNSAIEKRLQSFKDENLNRERLENSLTRITGLGLYDTVGYAPIVKDGKTGLAVKLNRKSHGPPFLRPLFILDSRQSGNTSFTIAARIVALEFPAHNSELRTDLSFGRVNFAGTEYYQFVGLRGVFVAPRGFVSQEQQIITVDGQRYADYKVRRAGGGFDVGYNFGRFSEFRTGWEGAHLHATVQIGFPVLPNAEGPEQLLSARWRFNGLNSGTIPTNGLMVDTQANWQFQSPRIFVAGQDLGNADHFGQAWSRIVYAHPFSQNWSGLFRVLGGGTFGGDVQPFSEFQLGGPLRLGSLETGELRGANVAFASGSVLRKFYDSPAALLSKAYAMVVYETGDAFDSRPNFYHSGTAGVMAETGMGIISAGYSYGERGRHSFFFAVGRIFDVGLRNSQLR